MRKPNRTTMKAKHFLQIGCGKLVKIIISGKHRGLYYVRIKNRINPR